MKFNPLEGLEDMADEVREGRDSILERLDRIIELLAKNE